MEPKDFATPNKPTWCPGCGNYGMFEALKRALSDLGYAKEEFAIVWGIGCHGNGADFWDVQGMHALHGRALPPATALSLTRPDLKVVVEMGDGDGYGIGLSHFVHSVRRNINITAIAHNNQIYGLTVGQASPTTDQYMRTISTPGGVLEQPVNPIGLALAEQASFVARGFAGDIPHLVELYKEALQHEGFALVDVFQPCVTFNKHNTFKWFRERIYKLDETGWDTSDAGAAFELASSTFHSLTCTPDECRVPIGVYYRADDSVTYNSGVDAADVPGYRRAEKPRDIGEVMAPLL